jgi:hypothetical protein
MKTSIAFIDDVADVFSLHSVVKISAFLHFVHIAVALDQKENLFLRVQGFYALIRGQSYELFFFIGTIDIRQSMVSS